MSYTDSKSDTSPTSRHALAIVIAIVFIDLLGFGIIIPILPYYVRSFGANDVFIGFLAAAYSVMQFIFAPLLGRISDQRGRRPVLLLSIAGSVVAWTVFGLGGSLLVLFASRMLAGAMGGNIATAQAYIADVTPPERRAGALGLLGAAFGLGFIFGPALGAVFSLASMIDMVRSVVPAVVPITRFSLPSFAAATLSLLNLGVAIIFLPETGAPTSADDRQSLVAGLVEALYDDRLRGLVASFFLFSVAFSGIEVMFIPFVADVYGYGESQSALLLTYVGVLSVIIQGGLVGRLSRRYSDTRIAFVGASVLVVALSTTPFAPLLGDLFVPQIDGPTFFTPALIALLGVLGLLSLGSGLLNVSLSTLVSKNASNETQGSAFGLTQGAGSLGRTAGPPIMAGLYAALTYWSPFVVGAVLIIPILLILARLARADGVVTLVKSW